MRVRMFESRWAAPDHINKKLFEAGKVYDVPQDLAEDWLRSRRCEQDKSLDGPSETKESKDSHRKKRTR